MLNKKSALLTASLLFGLGTAFFRIIIFNRWYIAGENRFDAGALTANKCVLITLIALSAVFAALSLSVRENGPAELPVSKGTRISKYAVTAALALVYPAAALVFGGAAFTLGENSSAILPLSSTIAALLPIVALVPTLIFFVADAAGSDRDSVSFKVLSFAPAVWLALYVVRSNFDLTHTFNDADVLVCNLACIFMAMRFLMESRYYIKYPKPRLYLALSCLSVMVGTAYVLPKLILTVVGAVRFSVNSCIEITMPFILVYFFLGTTAWARAENCETLPHGSNTDEDEEHADGEQAGEEQAEAEQTDGENAEAPRSDAPDGAVSDGEGADGSEDREADDTAGGDPQKEATEDEAEKHD